VEVNDPLRDPAMIPELVKKGYLVRTPDRCRYGAGAGAATQRCETRDGERTQMLSSDYYFSGEAVVEGYSVSFPRGDDRSVQSGGEGGWV